MSRPPLSEFLDPPLMQINKKGCWKEANIIQLSWRLDLTYFCSCRQFSYNQLQKCWDTPTKKRPFLIEIAASHTSVRYNTHLPALFLSKLFLQVFSMVLHLMLTRTLTREARRGGGGNHKDKIINRPVNPKQGKVSQVFCNWLLSAIFLASKKQNQNL